MRETGLGVLADLNASMAEILGWCTSTITITDTSVGTVVQM